uniref:TOP6B like initiator of meiotic double strand breaks n=1 Tax=Ovis aries TaxID=9940 RepID=A0AC11EF40_SHEEP
MQSILPGFFANLNWTSEEAGHSQDASGLRPFQMIFEADVKPRTLMTDSLVIKNFLRKIITVLPKIRFNFSVKVNGILSVEIFGAESEPALNLSNGIALVVNCQHYLSTPKFDTTELPCSRIHPVLGHPESTLCSQLISGPSSGRATAWCKGASRPLWPGPWSSIARQSRLIRNYKPHCQWLWIPS